jgi:hypothetical protein
MKKLRNGLYVLQTVIWPDEVRTVKAMILASGKTESGFGREMIGLEEKRRGAPHGNQNRRGKKGQGRRPKKPTFAAS